ncbi:MAG: 30S ribosomal protein S18 [Phycisphaeraceae bacterium]
MARFERFAASGQKIAVTSSTGKVYVDYRNADALRRLMSPNGKIYGRKRTGLNAYEQRLASQAIKRARYMALLPYTSATL